MISAVGIAMLFAVLASIVSYVSYLIGHSAGLREAEEDYYAQLSYKGWKRDADQ